MIYEENVLESKYHKRAYATFCINYHVDINIGKLWRKSINRAKNSKKCPEDLFIEYYAFSFAHEKVHMEITKILYLFDQEPIVEALMRNPL